MIVQEFKKPRKAKWQGHFPVVHTPPVVQASHFKEAGALAIAATRASKLGITTDEWLRRDKLVKEAVSQCNFRTNDVIYPPDLVGMGKYGKSIVVGRATGYEDIDQEEWPKSDFPFILTLQTLHKDLKQITFFATGNYPRKHEPTA